MTKDQKRIRRAKNLLIKHMDDNRLNHYDGTDGVWKEYHDVTGWMNGIYVCVTFMLTDNIILPDARIKIGCVTDDKEMVRKLLKNYADLIVER